MKNVVMARLMAKGHVIQKASPSVHMGSLLGHSLQRSLQKTVSSLRSGPRAAGRAALGLRQARSGPGSGGGRAIVR